MSEHNDKLLQLVITEFTEWQIKVVDGYLEYHQFVCLADTNIKLNLDN